MVSRIKIENDKVGISLTPEQVQYKVEDKNTLKRVTINSTDKKLTVILLEK